MFIKGIPEEVHKIMLLVHMRTLGLINDDTYVRATANMDPMSFVQYQINHASSMFSDGVARMLFGADDY